MPAQGTNFSGFPLPLQPLKLWSWPRLLDLTLFCKVLNPVELGFVGVWGGWGCHGRRKPAKWETLPHVSAESLGIGNTKEEPFMPLQNHEEQRMHQIHSQQEDPVVWNSKIRVEIRVGEHFRRSLLATTKLCFLNRCCLNLNQLSLHKKPLWRLGKILSLRAFLPLFHPLPLPHQLYQGDCPVMPVCTSLHQGTALSWPLRILFGECR